MAQRGWAGPTPLGPSSRLPYWFRFLAVLAGPLHPLCFCMAAGFHPSSPTPALGRCLPVWYQAPGCGADWAGYAVSPDWGLQSLPARPLAADRRNSGLCQKNCGAVSETSSLWATVRMLHSGWPPQRCHAGPIACLSWTHVHCHTGLQAHCSVQVLYSFSPHREGAVSPGSLRSVARKPYPAPMSGTFLGPSA